MPPFLVVKYGVNRRVRCSSVSPGPVSETSIATPRRCARRARRAACRPPAWRRARCRPGCRARAPAGRGRPATRGRPAASTVSMRDRARAGAVEVEHVRDHLVDVGRAQARLRHARELAELVDDAAQRAQLVEDGVARLAEQLAEARGGLPSLLLERAPQRLDRELDGEDRVLQLVRQAARHLAPGGDALGLQQPLARRAQLRGHGGEGAGQVADLVRRPRATASRGLPAATPRARPASAPTGRAIRLDRTSAAPSAASSRAAATPRASLRTPPDLGLERVPHRPPRATAPVQGRRRPAVAVAAQGRGPLAQAVGSERGGASRSGEPARATQRPRAASRRATSTPASFESSSQKAASREAAAHDDRGAAPRALACRHHREALRCAVSFRDRFPAERRAARERPVALGQAEARRPVARREDPSGGVHDLEQRQAPALAEIGGGVARLLLGAGRRAVTCARRPPPRRLPPRAVARARTPSRPGRAAAARSRSRRRTGGRPRAARAAPAAPPPARTRPAGGCAARTPRAVTARATRPRGQEPARAGAQAVHAGAAAEAAAAAAASGTRHVARAQDRFEAVEHGAPAVGVAARGRPPTARRARPPTPRPSAASSRRARAASATSGTPETAARRPERRGQHGSAGLQPRPRARGRRGRRRRAGCRRRARPVRPRA